MMSSSLISSELRKFKVLRDFVRIGIKLWVAGSKFLASLVPNIGENGANIMEVKEP